VATMTAHDTNRRLSFVFISQGVDRDDPVVPHTVRWIEALAGKPAVDHISVLGLRTGRYELPGNVDVYRFGRSNRLATLAAFYRGVGWSLRRRPNVFLVVQGGPYPLLLLPLKIVCRIPIVQWKAHSVITRAMTFYARRCDDLIFTATRASFPMGVSKVRIVGHGIDTQAFRSEAVAPLGDLIAAGRIAPIKRVAQIVRAVAHANRTYGTAYRLNIYGPTLPGDAAYAAGIEALIDRLDARDWVTLHGPVRHEHLPRLFSGHRVCISFGRGAVDKSALEAMACGLPVISTNDSVAEIIPFDLAPLLITERESTEAQAGTIHELLRQPDAEIVRLGERMRAVVVADHSVDRLFDRILEDVRTLLWDRG
jgi:glycosyltransferase involved in cell wall biosynthesis